jgi:hypothetical protein
METIKKNTIVKFSTIESERIPSKFAFIRFDENCLANFYIGINEKNNKCLLHDLDGVRIEFNGFEKENLKAYILEKKYLILEFTGDDSFFSQFLDLSCVIFNSIKEISEQQKSAEIFKELILRWSTFFSNKKNDKLGEKDIMGLWGEIYVVRDLILANKIDVNEILSSWMGPYDKEKDFKFSDLHLEIKTIKQDSELIEISSEFQLSPENDIPIELRVVKVRMEDNGLNLSQLVESTVNLIIQRSGQVDVFYAAIIQKVRIIDLNEYDNYCFAVNNDHTYTASNLDFPKITSAELKNGISKVKYKIELSKIINFLK